MNHSFSKCLALISILIASECQSQDLKIGEALPAMTINNVLNYPDSLINLAALKGKFLIFDFWRTNCPACLEAFPKIDSLQKKFKDQLQIILVTQQEKKVIKEFFEKRKKLFKPDVPMITGDKAIYNLFPRQEWPYTAFIDNNGILRYVASGYNLQEKQVRNFINNQATEIVQLNKLGHIYKTVVEESLLNDVMYFSCIARYNEALRTNINNGVEKGTGIALGRSNASIAELFIQAYSEANKQAINPSNFKVELADAINYVRPRSNPKSEEWCKNYSYSYELILPEERRNDMYRIMQEDLKRYFGLEIKKEKQPSKCLVLKRTGSIDLLKTKGGKAMNSFADDNPVQPKYDSIRYMRNMPFSELVRRIKARTEYQLGMPLVDETGYSNNIDIAIRAKTLQPFCLECLKEELGKYGVAIEASEREIELYVLRKKETTKD